jgi:hypothetical protein
MIPLILNLKVPRAHNRPVNLYLPLFIAWLLLIPVFLLLLPIFILGAILTWHTPYGRLILMFLPMVCVLLWHLQGLRIDVQNKKQHVDISFI